MRLNAIAYVYIAILLAVLVIMGAALALTFFSSKLMPLLVGGMVFILTAIQLGREIIGTKSKLASEIKEKPGEGKPQESWRGFLVNTIWVGGFTLSIYLLGYIIAIALFLLTYMKWLGTRWLTAIIAAFLTSTIVYFSFEMALKIKLYRGLLFIWLGY